MNYRKPLGHLALPYSASWYLVVPVLSHSGGSLAVLGMAPENKKPVAH